MIKNSINMSERTLLGTEGIDGDERRALRKLSSAVARDRYAAKAEEWDRGAVPFPHDERRYLGSLGLLGITLPEVYGGAGSPLIDALVVIEELAKECRPAAFQAFEANTGPAKVVSLLGTPAQGER